MQQIQAPNLNLFNSCAVIENDCVPVGTYQPIRMPQCVVNHNIDLSYNIIK